MYLSTDTSALLRRITRLEDIQEIHNIMGRRAYLHSAGRHDREIEELWSTRDDVVFEAEDMGAWTKLSSIKKSYVNGNPFPSGTKGLMIEHTLTTPVIEIAEDGRTAKGVWVSPGHETFPVAEGPPKAHWSWGRYAVDFRKEDGKWKIWHLHVLTTFRTPFGQDWAKQPLKDRIIYRRRANLRTQSVLLTEECLSTNRIIQIVLPSTNPSLRMRTGPGQILSVLPTFTSTLLDAFILFNCLRRQCEVDQN
jgi:hypothetical protein